MKKFSKRLLTFVLACAMAFGLSGMTAFAAEADDADSEPVALADDAASEPAAIDDDITYEDIIVYKHGDEVGTISGDDFAAAEAAAPEQTLIYYSGDEQSEAHEVTANFVLASTLLADFEQPDDGCGISIPTGGASQGGQTYEDWDDVYVYYDAENGAYCSAVDGTVGGCWVSGLTSIVLGHDYNDSPYCVICGAVNDDYEGDDAGEVGEYEPEYSWYNADPNTDVFHIKTPNQLAALSEIVNGTSELYSQNSFRGQTVYLDNDIEMNKEGSVELTYDFEGEKGESAVTTKVALGDYVRAFTPIGNMRYGSDGLVASGHAFEGTFDGQGNTVENLYVTGDEYVGLFGAVGVAPVAGEPGYGVIENFDVTGVVECTGDGLDFAAGVCAKLNAGGTIQNVINYAAVEAPNTFNVGGIVGFAGTNVKYGNKDIYDAYTENPSGYNTFVLCCGNEATIHGYYKQGGIVGENAATLMYCYNTGWILPHAEQVNGGWGGIVGRNGNNNTSTEEGIVAYCYNTGTITNGGYNDDYDDTVKGYAGIVGQEFGANGKCEVHNCYNIGSIPVGYNRYNSILSGPPEGAAVAVLYDNYTLDDPERIHNYVDTTESTDTTEMESGIKVEADDFIKTSYGNDDILTKLGPYFRADKEGINGGYPVLWWQVEGETEPVIENLQIVTGADKTSYSAGELFDPTGMVVVATYQNGIREIVPVGACMYDGMWFERQGGYSFKTDPLSDDDTEIEVSYKGYSDKQKITVGESSLDGITVTAPDKTIYSVGEYFDPTGMTITASFNNGDITTELSTDQVSFSPGLDHPLELTDTTITVTYEMDGQTASATVTITVSDEPKQDDEGRYLLSNVSELDWFANQVNSQNNNAIDAVLTADIDATESDGLPIGTLAAGGFQGTFDGDGHTVKIALDTRGWDSGSGKTYATGVIGYLNGGSVMNLTADGTVNGNGNSAGVVGYMTAGSVVNCTNKASVTVTGSNAGGVVGHSEGKTTVDGCVNDNSIEATGGSYVGGIVGNADTSACVISNCLNHGSVIAVSYVGGVVGSESSGASITNCGNDGSVTVTNSSSSSCTYVGGIAGYSASKISQCYNRGDILGCYYVGGIAGSVSRIAQTVDNCYNTGTITAGYQGNHISGDKVKYAAGGIAGGSGSAEYTNIFNTGEISALYAGALLGSSGSGGTTITINNGYYLIGTAEQPYVEDEDPVTENSVSSKTAEEIASEEFLDLINGDSAFKKGCQYPVLAWETEVQHTWGEVEWDWAEDFSSATASRTCTFCGETETADAEVTSVTTEPTTEADGSIVYTATATFADDTTVTDTRTVVLPKLVAPTVSVTVTSTLTGGSKTYDGDGVSLTAAVVSTPDTAVVSYQWYKDDEAISGATYNLLNLDGTVADSGSYQCVVTATNDGMEATDSAAITITIEKAAQEISYAETSIEKIFGDGAFTNPLTETTLSTEEGAGITYASSDADVAAVDETTGEVTIFSAGEATITATAAGTANYAEATASYTITVDKKLTASVTVTSTLTDNTKTYDGNGVSLTANAEVEPEEAEYSYQWYKDDEAITGENSDLLNLDGDVADSGTYKCVVSASYGTQTAEAEDAVTITINPATQELSYAQTTVTKYDYDGDFTNELTTGNVFGELSYTSSNMNVATIDDNGKVHIVGAGYTVITATAAGSDEGNYTSASANYTLTVNTDDFEWEIDVNHDQVNWDEDKGEYVDDITYTGADMELEMVITLTDEEKAAGASISYQWYRFVPEISDYEPIDGAVNDTYTLTGEDVNAGDYIYMCMAVVTYSNGYAHTVYSPIEVIIEKADQKVVFTEESLDKTVGDDPFTNQLSDESVIDTAGGAAITYVSDNTEVATVDVTTGEVTIVGVGEATITATVTATDNYNGTEAGYTVKVVEVMPTVSDVTITTSVGDTTKSYDGAGFNLTASADVTPEGVSVTYQWYGPDGAAIEGETSSTYTTSGNVSASGTYKCVVTATNSTRSASAEGMIEITIEKADQTVVFTEESLNKTVGDDPFTNQLSDESVIDTAGGATITYTSSDETVATVDETTGEVTIVSAGEAEITATASETTNYEAATASYTITIAADKAALQEEYDEDSQLSEEAYTPASWAPFAEALENAKAVLDDVNATQTEVDNALEALQTAKAGLVEAADKDALEAAIAEANGLDEDTYTPASWETLESALAAAESVDADPNATQGVVDAALDALESAMSELVEKADKDALEDAIEAAGELDEDNYTPDSWEALEDALTAAKAVDANQNASQADVDRATEDLENAMSGLVEKTDKDALEAEITAAEDAMSELVPSDYTGESWAALEEALEVAKDTDADPDALQSAIDQATKDLQDALDNLKAVPADKDALEDEITAAEDAMSGLIPSDYTEESWTELEDALQAAKDADADPDALQSAVDTATEALQDALDNLEAKQADKDALEEEIASTEDLTGSDYTEESWAALEEALEAAKDTDADPDALQSAVDQATKDLQDALDNLEALPADKDALEAEITASEDAMSDLIPSDYTEESWEALEDALQAAKDADADPDALQSVVDTATEALQDALDNLEAKPADKAALEDEITATEDAMSDLIPSDYTEESWAALEEALEAAKDTDADSDALQSAVDQATKDLQDALDNLEAVPADKAALEAEIIASEDAMSGLIPSDYTEESWEALEDALQAAKDADADPDALQSVVDTATEALQNALDNLEAKPADKTALEDEITATEDAMSELDPSDYTEDSWAALEEALAAAKAVDADPDALQSAVDEAQTALEAALNGLEVIPPDKEVLNDTIKAAEGLNKDNYTEDSWADLEAALTVAQAVSANDDASKDEVKEATIDLIAAIAGLKSAEEEPAEQPDKTDLLDEYVEGMNLTESDYTPESWEPFAQALADAQSVLTDPDATQDDVDAAEQALKTAMDNLVENGPVKNGLCQITPGELWGYYVDDVVDETYTGFASNENGDWWVVDGYVRFDVNSVEKDTLGKNGDKGVNDKGTWWYVIGNKVQHDFTGLANYKNANGWWYIVDGKVDFTHNGVDKNKNGWYYVVGGKVRFDFTGLANYKNDNGWWYIAGGKVDFTHNGVDKNVNGWYYMAGGKVRFDYTGVSNYSNKNGWWYIAGGKVDFSYTGRASNKNGTWNVVNGKVVF